MLTFVETAHNLMLSAHAEQVDKQGAPYFMHPDRVGKAVAHLGKEYEAAGYLHDVVEDTTVTLGELYRDFPVAVVDAVDALSRRKGEVYADFVARAAKNKIALQVKISDIRDNLRPGGSESQYKRYRKALAFLEVTA